jgi:hypothetical protein
MLSNHGRLFPLLAQAFRVPSKKGKGRIENFQSAFSELEGIC